MKINDVELTILVKGRHITEYPHQGQVFVEGRSGSEYELEVRNHSYGRIEAVISVDGLSVTDGKPAGNESRGYLIDPHGVVRIPGWLVNTATAAKFAFAGKQQSYAAQSGGDIRNNGVIGVMAFREKVYPTYWTTTLAAPTAFPPASKQWSGVSGQSLSTNSAWNDSVASSGSYSNMASSMTPTASASMAPRASASITANATTQQSLGTAFGDATQFATRTASFYRDSLLATLLCYYDERRGLKARGIRIGTRHKPALQPQAFPAMGHCQPPAGWQV